jgi:hypothetical protein
MGPYSLGNHVLLYTDPQIKGTFTIHNYYRVGAYMYWDDCKLTLNGIGGESFFGFSIVANGITVKNSSPSRWDAYTVDLGNFIGEAVNSGTVQRRMDCSSNAGATNYIIFDLPVIAPSAPGIPASISVSPASPAPGAMLTITSGTSQAGTAAVAAYEISYQKNGGAWTVIGGSGLSRSLSLAGYVHGNTITTRSRAYCTVNGANYWSGYRTSAAIMVIQPASGVPYNLAITPSDPAPGENISLSWTLPDVVAGFEARVYKNGTLYETIPNIDGLTKTISLTGWVEEDIVSFSIRAYRMSGGSTIYSGWAPITPGIPVRSRTYAFISDDGSAFVPYKLFLITDTQGAVELIKPSLRLIGGQS